MSTSKTITKHYRVQGQDKYTVQYIPQQNGTYKIFCVKRPDNPQSSNAGVTHIFASGEICITRGKEPRTLDKAQAIGMAFCEGFSRYLRTGKFPNGRKRVNV